MTVIQDFKVQKHNGEYDAFDRTRLETFLAKICQEFPASNLHELLDDVCAQVFNGISIKQIHTAAIMAARSRIEREPQYDFIAARLLLHTIYKETSNTFETFISKGISAKRLDPLLAQFDLQKITKALQADRDHLFTYLGLQTLYDRYLIHVDNIRIETPQFFWMRIAMGLALQETHKEERAIEFYHILSTFKFISGTPTLFNSGTLHPQLSSCYLSTVQDDLKEIFKAFSDNALLSKWAGGLGNDWTPVRAINSYIQGTNGKSQGLIPFLKIVNDIALAVNQGGKRRGAVCAYLEVWHLEIEEFIELRKNTGDDRRRTHDMNTANWIPDLFMKRVESNQEWTLFSPDETPDLHDLYGMAFEARYVEYEQRAELGEIKNFKRLRAVDLWKKMLSRLFETGHPWITWKDPSNIRSPQSHAGIIHSSNLCTEILLNTHTNEVAVCNLGSINLKEHICDGKIDHAMLQQTINTAVRMLDNVIDINFYPIEEARNANQRHRPVGIGLMGFQNALYELQIPYASEAAVEFADESMEAISYYALLASSELARECSPYQSYKGSKWDQGLLPIDTIELLEKERGAPIEVDRSSKMDWSKVRASIKKHGMRNSNLMAIAPTATISQIIGVAQSIEPYYTNLFVKSNLSGDFVSINHKLVEELKKRDLWNQDMLNQLKHHDGSLAHIDSIPEDLKNLFKTAFEVDYTWIIKCAASRQKWIDMGQSLNLYISEPSGALLDKMYRMAWKMGLKTTYYLRSRAATQVEKSTLDVNKYGIQPKWMKNKSASSEININRNSCSLDKECESCQ
jgi:ribonucleoside-diphosphate reductase alpha chain